MKLASHSKLTRRGVARGAERYSISATKKWRTVDGDGQGAVIKDRATGRAFIVLAEPEMQQRVAVALNFYEDHA